MKLRQRASVAALVALVEQEGPTSRSALQEMLGLSSYQMGNTVAYARLYGFVAVNAGEVSLTDKGRELAEAARSSTT